MGNTNHSDMLRALSEALRKTEEAYLEIADMMVMENRELDGIVSFGNVDEGG